MATAYGSGRDDAATVGGFLSRGFAAIGARPALYAAVSLVLVGLPGFAFGRFWRSIMPAMTTRPAGAPPNFDVLRTMLPLIGGTGLVWMLLYLLAQAILFLATVDALDGRARSPGGLLAAAARVLPALFILALLMTLAVWFGSILLLVPGIMLAMMWAVAAPVLVVERTGIFAAMGRSRRLTKGARWRIFGTVLIVFVLYYMAAGVIGVGQIAVRGVGATAITYAEPPIVISLLGLVIQAAMVAVFSAVQAAIYLGLRDRLDGPAGERLADIFA